MKFLKGKPARAAAFAAACIIMGCCAYTASDAILKNSVILGDSNDNYIDSGCFNYDIYNLSPDLWLIGNMYLRYLDENGEFTGSDELKNSTESAMRELGYMDAEGELILPENSDLEYFVSYGNASLSNTDKSFDELNDPQYSYTVNGNNIGDIPCGVHCWNTDSYHWYSTNYGMYYYYNGSGTAVFDFDTTGLDWYTDHLGAKIYYKTDGTTPIPIIEEYDLYDNYIANYTYEEYDEYNYEEGNELNSEDITSGFIFYNSDEGRWVHVKEDKFVDLPGDETPFKMNITPTAANIAAYEQAELVRAAEMDKFVRSLAGIIPLLLAAFVLMVYFLAMGGYSVQQGKFVMSGFDRIFAALPILLMFAALLGAAGLVSPDVISAIRDFLLEFYNSDKMLSIIYGISYALLFGIIILMLNTLIIRLKCRKFWKTTLIGRIFGFFFRHIKSFCRKARGALISREMLRNDIFTRRFIKRLVVFVTAEVIIIGMCIDFQSIGAMVVCSALLLGLYIFLSFSDLRSLNKLSEHISDMNSGDYSKREVPETDGTYCMTQKLNNISDGIQAAVDRQVKSERMKIDLVTNVSHDLKTPLTSIISYIDLLSAEELTPEAMDYVKILAQKSERLSAIVADLFDLAKATSRTDVQLELIDVVILTRQVLGDMEDKIERFGGEIRTDISMESAPVYAEGKKLYRVLQNLIDNALKYSLAGTRIYLSLREKDEKAVLTLKNISAYEMKFTPEEITERFARGDESRTSEGNGLGLSIAKSFTEACGGEFGITIDGDVFAAEIRLRLITAESKAEPIESADI